MRKNRLIATAVASALLASGLIGATSAAQAAERKIVVWVPFGGGNLAMWQASVDRIEAKNPGLTVELVGEIDMAKSLAAINAGNGPDISVANGAGNVGWFCGTGAWQNINDLVSGKKYNMPLNMGKTFTPGAVRTTLSGNVRCALPFSSEIFGFYYNKDLLKAKGIAVPKTTTQLIAASKKLTTFEANGDIKTAGYIPWASFMDNDMASLFLGHMFGARWFNAKGQSSFAADPAWGKAFAWQREFIRTVYGNGSFSAGTRKIQKFIAGSGDFWGGNNDFIKGRVAMLAHADWMSMMWCDPDGWNLNPCTTPAVNFGTAPLPVAPNLVKTHYGSGVMGNNTFGISRGSTNLKDAWIVLKGIATDKTLALAWANANGDPSSLLAARTKTGTNLAYPSFYQTFYDISNHKLSGYHPLLNTSEHLEETGLQQLMAAWQANTVGDIRNPLRDLAKRVNQIIARNK